MESEIDMFITVLKRVRNCDKAMSILEEMQQNTLFRYELDEIKEKPWVQDIKIFKIS